MRTPGAAAHPTRPPHPSTPRSSLPPRIPWRNPTLLAPMEGVGHPVWRALVAAHGGLGMVCTEFVRVGRGPLHLPSLLRRVERTADLPLSVQILGSDPRKLAEAARGLWASGVDVVDINLGCPSRRVVSKGAGAALLRDPDHLYDLLARVRGDTQGLLSAKIRAGLDSSDQLDALGDAVQAAGLDMLTIHPRTCAQGYSGRADWGLIRRLSQRLSIPVVGNGDCLFAADVDRMRTETGCAAVMIGRGALRNPWIFAQAEALRAGGRVAEPNGRQVLAFLKELTAAYMGVLGDRPGLVCGRLKELLRYLGRSLDDGGAFIREALRSPDTPSLLEVAESHLGALPARELDLGAAAAHAPARLPQPRPERL